MIITLSQRKGGSGKSTLSVSMAAELAGRGFKVGLLDTDEQGNSTKWGSRRERIGGLNAIEVKYCLGDIRDSIAAMYSRNDFLIIDTGGFDSAELRFALNACDLAVSPFKPKQFDLEVVPELLQIINLTQASNQSLIFRALINYAPTNAKDGRAAGAKDFLRSKGIECLNAMAYNREAWGDCTWDGKGVSEFSDDKAKDEISDIVEEVLRYGR